jgi:hypothetical protein
MFKVTSSKPNVLGLKPKFLIPNPNVEMTLLKSSHKHPKPLAKDISKLTHPHSPRGIQL